MARLPFVIRLAALMSVLCFGANGSEDTWGGIPSGPHAVGFRFRAGVDVSRQINLEGKGTALGFAEWYPAVKGASSSAMTQADYRLLSVRESLSPAAKEAFFEPEAAMMVAWRHVGIVDLTMEQARRALRSPGRAHRNAPPAAGKFPVVVILGGPWYLSTTAEILASHGFLVIAALRFSDQVNEVAGRYVWSMENDLRDAEWALSELRREPAADLSQVTSLGHGGGGMQALLLAMRNRLITAVANVDAANFSSRSRPDDVPFYDPRLLRVPYLYVARAETRATLDRFADFEAMRFSKRYEVVLDDSEVRHHDLSDAGRAVSTTLSCRGPAQEAVLNTYARVQELLVRFLTSPAADFVQWIEGLPDRGHYRTSVRDGLEPAPVTTYVLQHLEDFPVRKLREIRERDSGAALFEEDQLLKVASAARVAGQKRLALDVANFGLELHPGSLLLLRFSSVVLESMGDGAAALEAARRCAALPPPSNDWRATAAQTECRARLR